MTPLRQRMIEDMQLRGFSPRTQESYVTAVRQLAEHFHTSPDRLTEEDLRQYFLYLANEKKVARATATIALCGIKFFYKHTLQQHWTTLRFVRPPREKKLPVVLSRDEVRRILREVRIPVYRVCLTTIYACGLRLLEGAHLQVPDVDGGRMLLHIHGKGKKDWYVPLLAPTVERLHAYFATHRSPVWLFPALTRRGLTHALAHDGDRSPAAAYRVPFGVRSCGAASPSEPTSTRSAIPPRHICWRRGCTSASSRRTSDTAAPAPPRSTPT
jgi:integrase/recombinase XerD